MKKLKFLLAAIFISAGLFAQTDFSGTWELNNSESKLGERSFAPNEIVIVQNGNEMSVESHMERQGQEITRTNKYTLDGKESVNPGFRDSEVKSTAVWSDDKKSLKITSKFSMQNGDMTMVTVYKMNGASLVVESSSSSSFGDRSETRVYNKK